MNIIERIEFLNKYKKEIENIGVSKSTVTSIENEVGDIITSKIALAEFTSGPSSVNKKRVIKILSEVLKDKNLKFIDIFMEEILSIQNKIDESVEYLKRVKELKKQDNINEIPKQFFTVYDSENRLVKLYDFNVNEVFTSYKEEFVKDNSLLENYVNGYLEQLVVDLPNNNKLGFFINILNNVEDEIASLESERSMLDLYLAETLNRHSILFTNSIDDKLAKKIMKSLWNRTKELNRIFSLNNNELIFEILILAYKG